MRTPFEGLFLVMDFAIRRFMDPNARFWIPSTLPPRAHDSGSDRDRAAVLSSTGLHVGRLCTLRRLVASAPSYPV
jgi:hypothetical protein